MNTQELAKKIRIHSLEMTHWAQTSHIGSCLSCADILAVLYGSVMKYRPDEPEWEGRDRFVMSKGHASAALYATLAECGFFPMERLETFCQTGSALLGHVSHGVPGVDVSTGSLGNGLSIGCGMAIANPDSRVFVLLGDGDLNEGATWEAVMFAAQRKLSNLTVIVDYNQIQALGYSIDIMDLVSVTAKFEGFGWRTYDIEGHNHEDLSNWIGGCVGDPGPQCVVAITTKGKGVSFMENQVAWHYKYPNDEELKMALEELGAGESNKETE